MVHALNKHKNDEQLQAGGIIALASMIEKDASNAECLFEGDTLRMMLRNLHLHITAFHVNNNVCCCFHSLCLLCIDKVPALLEAGCVSYIVKAMSVHAEHSNCTLLVRCGCLTINTIINEYTKTFQSEKDMASIAFARIVEEGGPQAISSCLPTLLEKHSDVISQNFLAIGKLILFGPENVKHYGVHVIRPVVACILHCTRSRHMTEDYGKILISGCSLLAKVMNCA